MVSTSIRFQSTRPWEGATQTILQLIGMTGFQSTRPWEGATCPKPRCLRADDRFNPRARGRARPTDPEGVDLTYMFQSTRPWEGATRLRACRTPAGPRFNPRARGRARRGMPGNGPPKPWFQSTRPWEGATRIPESRKAISRSFNPRARGRARPANVLDDHRAVKVSIHAPVGGRDERTTIFPRG